MSRIASSCTAWLSMVVLSILWVAPGRGLAEDKNKDIWKPFLSEGELKKLIDDEVSIMKEELNKKGDRQKIQQAALLIAVAAQNWKEPKSPRLAASVRDWAFQLAKTAGEDRLPKVAEEEQWRLLDNMINRLAKFKELPETARSPEKPVDWKKHFEDLSDTMSIFSRDEPKGEVSTKEFMVLLSRTKPLKREQMTEKLQLMAYKTALIAEVTTERTMRRNKNYQKWTDDMREASLELATAVQTRKEMDAKNAILKLGGSCIACHEDFLGRLNVQELIAGLKAKDDYIRQWATDFLGDYGYAAEGEEYKPIQPRESGSLDDFRRRLKPAIPSLIETLKDENETVRLSASRALKKIGLKPEEPLPMFNEALHGSDEFVRFWFAFTFRDVKDKRDKVLPLLIEALKNPDKDIRCAAAEIMGRMPNQVPDANAALKEALDDKDADVRGTAAKALRQIGKESDIPALIKALYDSEPIVRGHAAIALARIGDPAVAELRKVLKDQDRDARAAAANSLGRIGPKAEKAVPDLKEMLKEKDEYLRLTAGAALAKIAPTIQKPD